MLHSSLIITDKFDSKHLEFVQTRLVEIEEVREVMFDNDNENLAMLNRPITVNEVTSAVMHAKNKKACGSDNIKA